MIKYHGTPVGGSKRDALLFLTGRHALISFANQQHAPEVINCCDSFCLDNGAFSIWKKGKGQIDEGEYKYWVDSLKQHPAFDFYIIPDVIDGTVRDNDDALKRWKGVTGGIPVYHMGEPIPRFRMLSRNYPYVCLGSTSKWPSVGSNKWWPYMADFMDAVCDGEGRPPCKLHGLRMLNPKVFTRLPLHSADSCNAAVNSGVCMKKGVYPNLERWQGSERIARRFEMFQSAPVWHRDNINKQNTDLIFTED